MLSAKQGTRSVPDGSPSRRNQIIGVFLAIAIGLAFAALGRRSHNWMGFEVYVGIWATRVIFIPLFKIGIKLGMDRVERKARLEWRRRHAQES
jgi:hypothetical protein